MWSGAYRIRPWIGCSSFYFFLLAGRGGRGGWRLCFVVYRIGSRRYIVEIGLGRACSSSSTSYLRSCAEGVSVRLYLSSHGSSHVGVRTTVMKKQTYTEMTYHL